MKPEFDQCRLYRGLENWMRVNFLIGTTIMALDIIGNICSPSFNPACSDIELTTVPLPYYMGFFAVSVPLNVFTSGKRIGYMNILVSNYNRNLNTILPLEASH